MPSTAKGQCPQALVGGSQCTLPRGHQGLHAFQAKQIGVQDAFDLTMEAFGHVLARNDPGLEQIQVRLRSALDILRGLGAKDQMNSTRKE